MITVKYKIGITLWRILRNLKDIPEESIGRDVFNAADKGDWCEYVKIMGGHTVDRNDWPVDQAIIGIQTGQDTYRSKSHIWIVRLKSKSTDPYT